MKPDALHIASLGAVLARQPKAKDLRPYGIGHDAARLLKLARGFTNRAVYQCNVGELTPRQQATEARAEKTLTMILEPYGATATTHGDPRGYVVKLKLATGDSNELGGAWGVW